MKITVYNTERFERSIWRYLIFGSVLVCVIIGSLFYDKGSSSIIGTIVLSLVIAVYFYVHIIQKPKIIELQITEKALMIDKHPLAWINIQGFAVEIAKQDLSIKNIVIVLPKSHYIFSLVDHDINQLETFVKTLKNYTPQLSEFEQTGLEKFYRKIKL